MSFHYALKRFQQELSRRGLLETAKKVYGKLGERFSPPWQCLVWMSLKQFAHPSIDDCVLKVIVRFDGEPLTSQIADLFGETTMEIFARRLAKGCHLHVLLKDGAIAGTLFVVLGKQQPFQHVVLTECDAAILDSHIEPQFRGQGLYAVFLTATLAALKDLGIERVYVATTESNVPSLRALHRVGFTHLVKYKVRGATYRYDTKPL